MNIKLNLINKSMDANNSQVVVFQKNVATDFEEIAVAWRVIQNLGRNDCHHFNYPIEFKVGSMDSWGNNVPCKPLAATNGQAFEVIRDTSGDVLQLAATPAASASEVEVRNSLQAGAISSCIYRDGKLMARKTAVAPGQKAIFEFKPTIFIGVVSQVEEGEVMNSAIVSSINTELSLLGVTSADIEMTGGGPGPTSSPFEFHLANINCA